MSQFPPFQTSVAMNELETDELHFPVIVQPKRDGVRIAMTTENGTTVAITRGGKRLVVSGVQMPANVVLDAELFAPWDQLTSILAGSLTIADSDACVYVFDAVTTEQWHTRAGDTPYAQRLENAARCVAELGSAFVKVFESSLVHNAKQLHEHYAQALANGFEGVVVKDPRAAYAFAKVGITKIKPRHTWKCTVRDWAAGSDCRSFGAWVVELNGVETRVGTGYSNAMRDEFLTSNPSTYVGRVVEVQGQELTAHGKIRFPSFVRFRDDVAA